MTSEAVRKNIIDNRMNRTENKHNMLKGSYEVCRFLLSERDLPNLLQGICDRLVEAGKFQSVLLVLIDKSLGGMITAETGMAERFQDVMDRLKDGELPVCGQKVMESENIVVDFCSKQECDICSVLQQSSQSICTAIKCTQTVIGFLIVHSTTGLIEENEDSVFFKQISESISHALRKLFADEEAKQREDELQKAEERYELALRASQAGLWDWNIQTGEMHTSPNEKEHLDYRSIDARPGSLQRSIHPDDKEKVLAILNDHLTGKSEEYRIEYRVKKSDGQWAWYLDRGRVVERDDNNMPVRMTGTHQNITFEKQQEDALAAIQQQLHDVVNDERNFLQTVIDSAGDPVIVIDLQFTILLVNKAASALVSQVTGERARQGKKCYQVFCGRFSACDDSRFPCPINEIQKNPRQLKLIHNPYHGNGVNNVFELDVSPLKNKDGELYGIIEVARDVTDRLRIEQELRDSQSRLYRLAHHDTLTGLPNRLLFNDRLSQAVVKTKRTKKSVAIMYMDLDKFKNINDTLGHDVGDELLIEVASVLQKQCRMSDTVARLGGDEFIFILDDIFKKEDVAVVAQKVLDAVKAPMCLKEHVIKISTSIGIALYPNDSDDTENVIKCADLALYKSKECGRGKYHFYLPEMDEADGVKLRQQLGNLE